MFFVLTFLLFHISKDLFYIEMYHQYLYCLNVSEHKMSEEYQRLKDIVTSLPSLPVHIPPEYDGKNWPTFFTKMLQKVVNTLDDGKMKKVLQKGEAYNVS